MSNQAIGVAAIFATITAALVSPACGTSSGGSGGGSGGGGAAGNAGGDLGGAGGEADNPGSMSGGAGGVAGEPPVDSGGAGGEPGGAGGAAGAATDATSCLTLFRANPALPSGEYEIDADGPDNGLAPFLVYCDMTADGGGWTTLPLRFSDSNYWSITHTGSECVTSDIQDNNGDYRQYQSSNTGTFAYTLMKFVPPIAATSVRFVDFNHTNGGTYNTMDFVMGGLPSGSATAEEGWYFADPRASDAPVGYAFPTPASCTAPYDVESYGSPYCSRDNLGLQNNAPTAPFFMNETVALSSTVAAFEMGLIEGCQSILGDPLTSGEQFRIETAPAADAVWSTGIQVR